MYSGQVTANKRDSGVDVVLGCFPERGDSIVGVFSLVSSQVKPLASYIILYKVT